MPNLEVLRLGVRLLKQAREMNVKEGRNVALIKQADVTQVDRLLEEHRRWNHLAIDEVPSSPHVVPFFDGREAEGSAGGSLWCQ